MSDKPLDMAELGRIWQMVKGVRIASTARMSHGGWEYLRDELPGRPTAPTFHPKVSTTLFGVPIEIADDIPPDRIVILDQHGKLLDVIMLADG